MDTKTGDIYDPDQVEKMKIDQSEKLKHLIEMEIPPTNRQMRRHPPKVVLNEPCPCGSGKKFKRCHFKRKGE